MRLFAVANPTTGRHASSHYCAAHAAVALGRPLDSTLVLSPDAGNGNDGFLQA